MCVWLRNELLFMQSFLGDAEEKQSGDHRVQQWVSETNDVANDVVAVLETYSFEAGEEGNGFKPWKQPLAEMQERWLAEHLKAEPRRSIISIYGMSGLGRTTLARNLYTSPNIVYLPTRAKISVSHEYNTMDLLWNISIS
ncbi:putative nitric oxide-associated protein 1-like [Capsicum annuum]|nr:putative nitric oxide-associated protein 1-like [Capsicum annuum]